MLRLFRRQGARPRGRQARQHAAPDWHVATLSHW